MIDFADQYLDITLEDMHDAVLNVSQDASARVNCIVRMKDKVIATGVTSKGMMEELEKLAPGCVHELMPVNSYTQEASTVNYEFTLESIDWAKVIMAGVVIASVAAAIYLIIKLLKDQHSKNIEEARQRAKNTLRENNKKLHNNVEKIKDKYKSELVPGGRRTSKMQTLPSSTARMYNKFIKEKYPGLTIEKLNKGFGKTDYCEIQKLFNKDSAIAKIYTKHLRKVPDYLEKVISLAETYNDLVEDIVESKIKDSDALVKVYAMGDVDDDTFVNDMNQATEMLNGIPRSKLTQSYQSIGAGTDMSIALKEAIFKQARFRNLEDVDVVKGYEAVKDIQNGTVPVSILDNVERKASNIAAKLKESEDKLSAGNRRNSRNKVVMSTQLVTKLDEVKSRLIAAISRIKLFIDLGIYLGTYNLNVFQVNLRITRNINGAMINNYNEFNNLKKINDDIMNKYNEFKDLKNM